MLRIVLQATRCDPTGRSKAKYSGVKWSHRALEGILALANEELQLVEHTQELLDGGLAGGLESIDAVRVLSLQALNGFLSKSPIPTMS